MGPIRARTVSRVLEDPASLFSYCGYTGRLLGFFLPSFLERREARPERASEAYGRVGRGRHELARRQFDEKEPLTLLTCVALVLIGSNFLGVIPGCSLGRAPDLTGSWPPSF